MFPHRVLSARLLGAALALSRHLLYGGGVAGRGREGMNDDISNLHKWAAMRWMGLDIRVGSLYVGYIYASCRMQRGGDDPSTLAGSG